MLESIAGRWAAKDVRTASAWAAQLPPGSSRDSFVAGLSSTLGETAPEEAADFVATMIPGPRQEGAALTVLLEWGQKISRQRAIGLAFSRPAIFAKRRF